MSKWICIEETTFLTLHNNITGNLYVEAHYVGDIVEVKNGMIYFIDTRDNNTLYIGSLDEDKSWHGVHHNEPELKEYFMPLSEWREQQINSILND